MAQVFNMSTINNIYGQKQSFLDAGIDLILGHRLIRLLIDCGDKTISRPSSNNGIAYMGKMTYLSLYIYMCNMTPNNCDLTDGILYGVRKSFGTV